MRTPKLDQQGRVDGEFITLVGLAAKDGRHKSNVLRDIRKWEKLIGRPVTQRKRADGRLVCALTRQDAVACGGWRGVPFEFDPSPIRVRSDGPLSHSAKFAAK